MNPVWDAVDVLKRELPPEDWREGHPLQLIEEELLRLQEVERDYRRIEGQLAIIRNEATRLAHMAEHGSPPIPGSFLPHGEGR